MAATDSVSNRIPEWKLQAAIASEYDRLVAEGRPFAYAASLEGVIGTLRPYQAQLAIATGVKRGEPDLRLYMPGGRLVFIELKGDKGKLTDSQKARIPILRGLGFIVHVLFAVDEDAARREAAVIVEAELSGPESSRALASATWWPKVRKAA